MVIGLDWGPEGSGVTIKGVGTGKEESYLRSAPRPYERLLRWRDEGFESQLDFEPANAPSSHREPGLQIRFACSVLPRYSRLAPETESLATFASNERVAKLRRRSRTISNMPLRSLSRPVETYLGYTYPVMERI